LIIESDRQFLSIKVFWVVTPGRVAIGYQHFTYDGGSMTPLKIWYPTTTLHGITTQKT